jgi:hypothetical protein
MTREPQSLITSTVWDEELDIPRPDVSNLITEDDTPVDNLYSEKQMRLLTHSLYASWKPGFPFVSMANVGVWVALNRPPVVPDVLVTTHVTAPVDVKDAESKSYFSWQYDGKVPDVVVEIVSNTKGGELDYKLRNYEHIGVSWYVVYDPLKYLKADVLSVFRLSKSGKTKVGCDFAELGLGVTLWEGRFEDATDTWLRWTGADGQVLMTSEEQAELARHQAEQAQQRADAAEARMAVMLEQMKAAGLAPS